MMRRIELKPCEPFQSSFIDRTGAFNAQALQAATSIVEDVRERGDAALIELTERFDGIRLEELRVPQRLIDEAADKVDPQTMDALRHAARQIRAFHERQVQQKIGRAHV